MTLTLPPEDYVLAYKHPKHPDPEKDCVIGIAPEVGEGEWTVG